MFFKNKIEVLLICDQKWRDLPSVCLLKKELEKQNVKSQIVNAREALSLLTIFQPDMVVLNNIYSKSQKKIAKILSSFNVLITVLPTEGRGEPSLEKLNGSQFLKLENVDLYFTWNERTKRDLQKKYLNTKIVSIGCQRYDVFHKNFNHIITPKKYVAEKYKLDINKKTVLWTTKFGYAHIHKANKKTKNLFYKELENNQVTTCYELDGLNWKKIPENHYLTRELHAEIFFKLVKSMPELNFLIKPHPTEDKNFYIDKIISNNLNNCILCKEDYIFDILNVTDILIQQKCTTALEGWIFNIPVINLSISKFHEFDWKDFTKGSIEVSNFKQLKINILKILNNNYKLNEKTQKIRDFWIKEFTIKIDGKMTTKVCAEIAALLKRKEKNKLMTAKIFGLSPFRVIIMYLKHLLNLTSQESIISYLISFNKINKNFVSKESTRKDVQIFLKRFKKIYE